MYRYWAILSPLKYFYISYRVWDPWTQRLGVYNLCWTGYLLYVFRLPDLSTSLLKIPEKLENGHWSSIGLINWSAIETFLKPGWHDTSKFEPRELGCCARMTRALLVSCQQCVRVDLMWGTRPERDWDFNISTDCFGVAIRKKLSVSQTVHFVELYKAEEVLWNVWYSWWH